MLVLHLHHSSDVLAVAYRPDGRELCVSTRDGKLSFWNTQHSALEKVINGQRDAAGGRKTGDVRTAKSTAAGKCFTSVCYTADGECVIAGGRTKYVCIYAVAKKLLLKRFQLSHNRSIEGTLDKLNSKNLTEAGDMNELDMSDSDEEKRYARPRLLASSQDDGPSPSCTRRVFLLCVVTQPRRVPTWRGAW